MMEEFLDVGDRNREAQVVGDVGLSTPAGHADHLAALVEQRAPRIAGIDRRVGLEEELALEVPAAIADDALRDRPLQPQRIADREDRVAGIDVVTITQDDVARFQVRRAAAA